MMMMMMIGDDDDDDDDNDDDDDDDDECSESQFLIFIPRCWLKHSACLNNTCRRSLLHIEYMYYCAPGNNTSQQVLMDNLRTIIITANRRKESKSSATQAEQSTY
jgi:hypothetical protein